jgi:hypothetical protein
MRVVEETPLDRAGFVKELSEALVYAFTCEIGHHGLVGDCFRDGVLHFPWGWVCYAQQEVELLW